ncbi:hypothetical protein CDAR_242321 [Caerostris darwini]|uniref:Uncharacterized protein n=1 Tax=Caerostris darwini TaxID=1538125 RepID=A0AAV4RU25_9ARAC|nr:hypothetical protein CDAR_242321 [Caerostris darwini]
MEAFSSKTERKRNCATVKPLTSDRILPIDNTTRPAISQTGDALSAPTLLLEQSPLWTLEKTTFYSCFFYPGNHGDGKSFAGANPSSETVANSRSHSFSDRLQSETMYNLSLPRRTRHLEILFQKIKKKVEKTTECWQRQKKEHEQERLLRHSA